MKPHPLHRTSAAEAILMVVVIGILFFSLFGGCAKAHAQTNLPSADRPSAPSETKGLGGVGGGNVNNAMPAFQAVEQAVAADSHWYDHLDVGVGCFVSLSAPRLDTSLIAGQVSLNTTSNTFVQVAAFGGIKEHGGGAAAGGLKSSSTFTVPIIDRTIHTTQSIAAGITYVSGSSGTRVYGGLNQPVSHGWENYVETTVVAKVGGGSYVGATVLLIGVTSYIGLVFDESF
jgi:hypothetical protein